MASKMPDEFLTIYSSRPAAVTSRERFVGTHFVLNWPPTRTLSNWYILSRNLKRIYLKIGWNLFGQRHSNHIQLKSPFIRPSEILIFIADNERPPFLISVNKNVVVDGVLVDHDPVDLCHRHTIGLMMGHKIMVIQVRNEKKNTEPYPP